MQPRLGSSFCGLSSWQALSAEKETEKWEWMSMTTPRVEVSSLGSGDRGKKGNAMLVIKINKKDNK